MNNLRKKKKKYMNINTKLVIYKNQNMYYHLELLK